MSKLLIHEQPLQVLPSLAAEVGLNEAIFLQQLHYWLLQSKFEHGGRKWIYNTFGQWRAQFPFWDERTIQRIVRNLRERGFILSEKLRKAERNHTNFYTIEYDKLSSRTRQLVATDNDRLSLSDHDKVSQSETTDCRNPIKVTETTTETTTEKPIVESADAATTEGEAESKKSQSRAAQAREAFAYWQEVHNHPKAVFDGKRQRAVEGRLKDGYTLDFIFQAIRGIKRSKRHMGENDRHEVYDDIELICRDGPRLEKFAGLDVVKIKQERKEAPQPRSCLYCEDGTETVVDRKTGADIQVPCSRCGGRKAVAR